MNWTLPSVTDQQIHAVEEAILHAFDARSTQALKILGLGELGLAVGWPADDPIAVFKRQAPGPIGQLDADVARMHRFHAALEASGCGVLPTDVRTIVNRDDKVIPYLIQPVVSPNQLAENIIASDEPDPEHPVLVSVRDTVDAVVRDDHSGGLSIDAQITNFAWDGTRVHSIDTTPPLMWPAEHGPMHDVGNYLTAVPWVLRPVALALTKRAGNDYRTVRGVLELTAVYLLRIDQERWVEAALKCFNEVVDTPITRTSVDQKFDQMVKDLPTIKRLARIQRAWITKVRKDRYEFFITNSFTGEIY